MSRPRTRLARVVDVARLREEQARRSLAGARSAAAAAQAEVRAGQVALGDQPPGTAFLAARGLQQLALGALGVAEARAGEADRAAEREVAGWTRTNQRLEALERLEQRLVDAVLADHRRQEQREGDDLAATRHRRPR